jgi:hypothetical protein
MWQNISKLDKETKTLCYSLKNKNDNNLSFFHTKSINMSYIIVMLILLMMK